MVSGLERSPAFLRAGMAALALCALAACESGIGGTSTAAAPAAPAAPAPDFATYSDQFVALQSAGLQGDYAAFANALKIADPAAMTAELTRSFRGGPFDVYTRNAKVESDIHHRAVELRSTSGRLYLYVSMKKVPGGWIISDHTLDRKRSAIMARL